MSAIWGQVSFEGNVYDQITVMKEPYQRKCRLDRIEQYKRPDCYMGCGIQYITGESVLEQMRRTEQTLRQTAYWIIEGSCYRSWNCQIPGCRMGIS